MLQLQSKLLRAMFVLLTASTCTWTAALPHDLVTRSAVATVPVYVTDVAATHRVDSQPSLVERKQMRQNGFPGQIGATNETLGLKAARIFMSAAAAVTPGYGRLGHIIRRATPQPRKIKRRDFKRDTKFLSVGLRIKPSRQERRDSLDILGRQTKSVIGIGNSDFPTVSLVAKKAVSVTSSSSKTCSRTFSTNKPSSSSVKSSTGTTSSKTTPRIIISKTSNSTSSSQMSAKAFSTKTKSSSNSALSTSTGLQNASSCTRTTSASSSYSPHSATKTVTSRKTCKSTILKTSTTSRSSSSTSIATTSNSLCSASAPSSSTATSTSTAASSYSTTEAMADMEKMMSWAGVSKEMTDAQKTETVAALLSAAGRYFPELSTRDTVRYMLADINAESSFNVKAWNAGRDDSGESLGLFQVSPASDAQELPIWMRHARGSYNSYSWSTSPGPAGVLIDYDTRSQLVFSTLKKTDLLRPWVNIHLSTWMQSNLARTSSCNPSSWTEISQKAYAARTAEKACSEASSIERSFLKSAITSAQSAETKALVCSGLSRSVLTGLGSWVAGPAVDGSSSYKGSKDDVSAPYFANILKGIRVLYGNSSLTTDWLDGLTLTAGLVDFH